MDKKVDNQQVAPDKTKNVDETIAKHQVKLVELELQNESLRIAKEDLEESQDRYTNQLGFNPTGFFILNRDKVILEANRAGAAMLGMEKNSLIKTNFLDLIAPHYQDIFDLFSKLVFKTRKTQSCEIKLLKKDGGYCSVLMTSRVVKNAIGIATQQISVMDICVQKLAEEALRQSEEKYHKLYSSVPVGLAWSSASGGKIIECNEYFAKLAGYDNPQECINEFVTTEHYADPEVRKQLLSELSKPV